VSVRLRAARFVAGFLLLFTISHALAGELEERAEISQKGHALFEDERFAELEALAEDYRAHGSRTSSGLWKIGILHNGIEEVDGKNRDDKYWSALMAKSARWIAAFPQSPTARIAHASFLSSHAWAVRGGGWSRDVPKDDWPPFHRLIEQSRSYLLANKEIGKADPQWYQEMLTLARVDGSGDDAFNVLIDEATWKYPDYYPNYFTAIEYLGPRWHGNLAAIEEFANRAVRKTREIEGQGMYARIYWYVSQMQFGERLFEDTSVVWPKMKRGIDDVLKRYPDQWNINNFAHFACLASDRKETARLTARVTEPIADAWAKDVSLFARCREWANGDDTNARSPFAKPVTQKTARQDTRGFPLSRLRERAG
jgi:hypothetical protein